MKVLFVSYLHSSKASRQLPVIAGRGCQDEKGFLLCHVVNFSLRTNLVHHNKKASQWWWSEIVEIDNRFLVVVLADLTAREQVSVWLICSHFQAMREEQSKTKV